MDNDTVVILLALAVAVIAVLKVMAPRTKTKADDTALRVGEMAEPYLKAELARRAALREAAKAGTPSAK